MILAGQRAAEPSADIATTPEIFSARADSRIAAGDDAGALALLRQALAAGDRRPVTRLNLALAESRQGDRSRARQLLVQLDQELPGWAEPPLHLAELSRAEGNLPAAIACFERALERAPQRPKTLLALGALLVGQGDPGRAKTLLLQCCALDETSWQAWDALGAALLAIGDFAAAESALSRAHRLAPGELGVALRLVAAALATGTHEAALARFSAASLDNPVDPVPLAARGVLLARLRRDAEAIDLLEAALALDPDNAMLASTLVDAMQRAGQDDATLVAALRRALDLDQANPALRNNFAAALTQVHRHQEACAEFQRVLDTQGETADVLCNLAGALTSLGRQDEGIAAARRATEIAPRLHGAWRTLANAMAYGDGIGGRELLDTLRLAGACAPRGSVPPLPLPVCPDPEKRLSVGLLSATLRTHPVGWLALAGIENLDPGQFELVGLAQPDSADSMQCRFRAAASEWHVATGHVALQARNLALDVLIDLGGYGHRGLMIHCAERLAPLQIKWVGMQNHSSGLAEMDLFVTDRWETPPELAQYYSERLLMMPDGYACYSPPSHAPDVAALPAMRTGHITFGCFNNYAKITARLIATWCDILHAVPDARLVLKTHQFDDPPTCESALGRFAAHGIDPARIELRGASTHRRLLAQYGDIDIVLDPHPYSGGLTTCEALWMGVPVVTLPGETFASRHSTSHLCNIGLEYFVASDFAAYRELAIAWARDRTALAALRQELRGRMQASPLCDGPRFGRNFGQALRAAWRDWCLGREAALAP